MNDNLIYTTDGENKIYALGMFKNGDVEVKYSDGELSYRVPKETFNNEYKIYAKDLSETTKNDAPNLDDLNIKQLRAIAKEKAIKGYSNMNKENLLTALKAE